MFKWLRLQYIPFTIRSPITNEPYMDRWVLQCRFGTLRIHHILSKDWTTEPHDHPWNFVTIVLKGGYTEERPHQTIQRRAGAIAYRKADDLHYISDVLPGGAWTLCITGPWRRRWGFKTAKGGVYWKHHPFLRRLHSGKRGRKPA